MPNPEIRSPGLKFERGDKVSDKVGKTECGMRDAEWEVRDLRDEPKINGK